MDEGRDSCFGECFRFTCNLVEFGVSFVCCDKNRLKIKKVCKKLCVIEQK